MLKNCTNCHKQFEATGYQSKCWDCHICARCGKTGIPIRWGRPKIYCSSICANTIKCNDCGRNFLRLGQRNYLCLMCAKERKRLAKLESAKKWQKENPEKVKINLRERDLQRKFGIGIADYEKLLGKQNGVCAICNEENMHNKRLAVDHCHSTDQIRGLLCDKCNRGLGLFQDSPDLLIAASLYLISYTNILESILKGNN